MSRYPLKITFIGHATVLLQRNTEAFLTDPNFSNRLPMGKHRLHPPGLPGYQLPALNALLISQGGFAHLDLFSFKYFSTGLPVVVPKGLGRLVRKFLPNPVTEIHPGGTHAFRETLLRSVPVLKKGGRWNPFRFTAATGYVLEWENTKVFFTGDTGYSDRFKKIGEEHAIDVALLPVQWRHSPASGAKSSLSPAKAVRAAKEMGAKLFIPIAWDAFSFGKKKPEEIISEIRAEARREGMLERLKILQPGESVEL